MLSFKPFLLSGLILASVSTAFSAGTNANTKNFGYDWVDYPGETLNSSLAAINSTGPAATNFNIVRTLAGLNSTDCKNSTCAVNISIGHWQEFEICPGARNWNECITNHDPWINIWNIISTLSKANNLPKYIYLSDEPSHSNVFKGPDGAYTPYSFASFICTFRDAMAANGVDIPIFTILAMGELSNNPDEPASITRELRHQASLNVCPSGRRSMPDAIGIDNYYWKYEAGVQNDVNTIYNLYSKYFPNDGVMPKWILVPPGHLDIPAIKGKNDAEIKKHIQVYWELMATYPNAPIESIMVHRFDRRIMTVIYLQPNYQETRDLLKYMGNMIVN